MHRKPLTILNNFVYFSQRYLEYQMILKQKYFSYQMYNFPTRPPNRFRGKTGFSLLTLRAKSTGQKNLKSHPIIILVNLLQNMHSFQKIFSNSVFCALLWIDYLATSIVRIITWLADDSTLNHLREETVRPSLIFNLLSIKCWKWNWCYFSAN